MAAISGIALLGQSTDVRYTAAFGDNPDIEPTTPNDRV
jgi:hypothetical protein